MSTRVLFFFFFLSFFFYILSLTPDGAPFKERIARVYGSSPLEKVKNSILLFIKAWICMIAMCSKKKLKKVGYDREVQK
jgi:hypothetical protein